MDAEIALWLGTGFTFSGAVPLKHHSAGPGRPKVFMPASRAAGVECNSVNENRASIINKLLLSSEAMPSQPGDETSRQLRLDRD